MLSTLLVLIVVLAIVSLACWGVQSFLPGPPAMKNIICALCVLFAILWLLGSLGMLTGGRLRV